MLIDTLICATLRGERPAWPWGYDEASISDFLSRAATQGSLALLHNYPTAPGWPANLVQHLRSSAIQLAMWELAHQQILSEALAGLHRMGVQPVLIKGTALAYSLYADPALRTRADTDLIVPGGAKERTDRALLEMGFRRAISVSGELVTYQTTYSRSDASGAVHALDVHWKINNSEILSRLFTYDELRADAQLLPQLCLHALGASPVHALLIACMHRMTHKQNPYYVGDEPHHDADRLIWLYDIHLLATRLNAKEWDDFLRLARSKSLRAVCLEGMQRAQASLHTTYPDGVLAELAAAGATERPALYLNGSRLRQQRMDFLALGSVRQQLRFAGELLFPSAAYMRHKYATSHDAWLPWLYLRRAAGGIMKRLVGHSAT